MKGLMLLMGKGAKGPKEEEPEEAAESEGPERTYAREAFSALKDDDEEGFIEAFLGAVRACSKMKATDYDGEE
jgi:hypothetical protein